MSADEKRPKGLTGVTSAGVPWSEVDDSVFDYVAWMDGVYGSAKDALPSIAEVPVPEALLRLPWLNEARPRGSKAMIDAGGAKQRLSDCRPGAWLLSPYTGWKWAKWPTGEVGWLPADVSLPDVLRVPHRDHDRS